MHRESLRLQNASETAETSKRRSTRTAADENDAFAHLLRYAPRTMTARALARIRRVILGASFVAGSAVAAPMPMPGDAPMPRPEPNLDLKGPAPAAPRRDALPLDPRAKKDEAKGGKAKRPEVDAKAPEVPVQRPGGPKNAPPPRSQR